MKNRIAALVEAKHHNILSIYFTAGFPHGEDTIEIAQGLEAAGVDLIEIGIPFSDPLADGPVIQESNKAALENGMSVKKVIEQVTQIRKKAKLPILLMGYLNPIMQYGVEQFCADISAAGADGVIIPDLPIDVYQSEYRALFEGHRLTVVFLISPTTSAERIRLIDEMTNGFIYAVSASSTTGMKGDLTADQEGYFKKLQEMNLKNPFLIGFGISNRVSFMKACQYGAGAIVGSAFINALKDVDAIGSEIPRFVNSLKSSVP